jgi:hypothetical protein
MNKRIYFPRHIWRNIFKFDSTYRTIFNNVINDINKGKGCQILGIYGTVNYMLVHKYGIKWEVWNLLCVEANRADSAADDAVRVDRDGLTKHTVHVIGATGVWGSIMRLI